jgi:hypothetical protein
LQQDFFDGFPYQVTRVAPSLYHLLVLPAELSLIQLKDILRWQARANKLPQCLVAGPDRCTYFEPDGGEADSSRVPSGGHQVTGLLFPCYRLPATGETLTRVARLRQWAEVRGRWADVVGDPNKGGRPATAEELAWLTGCDANGIPKGLSRCPACGDFRGECLDPGARLQPLLVPVSCRCENDTLCARCAKPLAGRRLNSNFLANGLVWHVPGFAAFRHECQEEERQETADLGPLGRLARASVWNPQVV